MSYISDRELIRAAIQSNISDMNIDDTEASVKKYLSEHPHCCSVDHKPNNRIPIVDFFLGTNNAEVELNYERKNAPKTSSVKIYYKKFITVSVCGKALHDYYGTTTSTLEKSQPSR